MNEKSNRKESNRKKEENAVKFIREMYPFQTQRDSHEMMKKVDWNKITFITFVSLKNVHSELKQ